MDENKYLILIDCQDKTIALDIHEILNTQHTGILNKKGYF